MSFTIPHPEFKVKPAKRADIKTVTKLFLAINRRITRNKVEKWINKGKVFVLKDNKKVRAAFSYSIFGILGFLSLMYIEKISVSPRLYGQGIGSYVLAQIKTRSIKIGTTAFFLYSLKSALAFYKKNKLNRLGRIFWWSAGQESIKARQNSKEVM